MKNHGIIPTKNEEETMRKPRASNALPPPSALTLLLGFYLPRPAHTCSSYSFLFKLGYFEVIYYIQMAKQSTKFLNMPTKTIIALQSWTTGFNGFS